MKQDSTHIAVVLDRSGSMDQVKEDTIGGFNHFIESQKPVPGECTVTLVQFDDVIETVYANMEIKRAPMLTNETYKPRNSTALLDAIGKTIGDTGDYLKSIPEDKRPAKVVCVILTDGLENSSRKFTRDEIFQMITHQREVYKWEFVFIGANQDAIRSGTAMGNVHANNLTMDHSKAGFFSAYGATGQNLRSFRVGAKMNMSFEPEQVAEQEALLKAKGKKK